MIQTDLLVVYLNMHLHCHRLEPFRITFPKISQIVVPEYQVNLPIQPVKNTIPLSGIPQTKVTEMKHDIIWSDGLIPVCNQSLIHILHVFEWPIAKLDDICMTEMGIGCEKHITPV